MRLKDFLITERYNIFYYATFSEDLPDIKKNGIQFSKDEPDKIYITDTYTDAFYYFCMQARCRDYPPMAILKVKPYSSPLKSNRKAEFYVTQPILAKSILAAPGWNKNKTYLDINQLKGTEKKVAERNYT